MTAYGIRAGPSACCPEQNVENGVCTACGHDHTEPEIDEPE